ncbi:hypothetical protein EON64_11730 [archaeon]|nr:MAG: hypothetical protein EON64_11730 [archaeon]
MIHTNVLLLLSRIYSPSYSHVCRMHRVLFTNVANLFWNMVLSKIANKP